MWIQNLLILAVSTAVLSKPAAKPDPISVYQQGEVEDQQEYQQQYRPQIQYKPQPQPQPQPQSLAVPVQSQLRQGSRALYKAQPGQDPRLLQQPESEDYEMGPPQPYQFSFDVNDDENTNYQNRKEQREGNKISGSYSVVDSDGFIRTVTYTADPVEGFKAHVSREPTNIVVKVPTPQTNLDTQTRVQYTPGQTKQVGIQYNGAPVPRPQFVSAPQHTVATPAPSRQSAQQYVQSTQDLLQYQPVYQGQAALTHSPTSVGQAPSSAQINQYLTQASQSQAAPLAQYSDPNAHLRG